MRSIRLISVKEKEIARKMLNDYLIELSVFDDNIKFDDILSLFILLIPVSLVCARLYYIITCPTLNAMRYIVSCPQEKLLAFSLAEDDMYLLSRVTEGYLVNHLEHPFATLEFYKSILI